jgi:hypothetical protein
MNREDDAVSFSVPDKLGGLNGSTQHFPEVYSQESENLKFVVGVDLSAARPRSSCA